MSLARLLTSVIVLSSVLAADSSYKIAKSYAGADFQNDFDFFTAADPTGGYVNYVSQSVASSEGLISTAGGTFRMGVDASSIPTARGRDSVRITSKDKFSDGIYILDLAHMPVGCGTWPAFWTTTTKNWPAGGEIDILEGANGMPSAGGLAYNSTTGLTSPAIGFTIPTQDTSSLHTNPGCTLPTVQSFQQGTTKIQTCDANQNANSGCGIQYSNSTVTGASLGNAFNQQGGGWYAMWRDVQGSGGIYMYFWPRNSATVPPEVKAGTATAVSAAAWGTPTANFSIPSCTTDFNEHVIVFNIALCGDYTAASYSQSGCPGTCEAFVKQNPSAFAEAYFLINSLRVYTSSGKPFTTGMPVATLVGIVVGAVVGLGLIVGFGIWYCLRRRKANALRSSSNVEDGRDEKESSYTNLVAPRGSITKKISDESISTTASKASNDIPVLPRINRFSSFFSSGSLPIPDDQPEVASTSKSPHYQKRLRGSFVPQVQVKRSGPTAASSILSDGRIVGETDAMGRLAGESKTTTVEPAFAFDTSVDDRISFAGTGQRRPSYANPMAARSSRAGSMQTAGAGGPSWIESRKPSTYRKPSQTGRPSFSKGQGAYNFSRPTSTVARRPSEFVRQAETRRPSEFARPQPDRRESSKRKDSIAPKAIEPTSPRFSREPSVWARESSYRPKDSSYGPRNSNLLDPRRTIVEGTVPGGRSYGRKESWVG